MVLQVDMPVTCQWPYFKLFITCKVFEPMSLRQVDVNDVKMLRVHVKLI